MSLSALEQQLWMQTHPFMTCVLWINNRSSGWQKTVNKILKNVYGITNCRMNEEGMLEISGNVDPHVLLKMLEKAWKKVEICHLQYGQCSSNLFVSNQRPGYYYEDNYGRLGYYGGQLDGRFLHYGEHSNFRLKWLSKKKLFRDDLDHRHRHGDTKFECTVAAEARERCRRASATPVKREGVLSCCLM